MTPPIGRQHLHKRVQQAALSASIAPDRARRWVAAGALLELLHCAREQGTLSAYHLKGGFAIELRLRDRARTSRDVDLVFSESRHEAVRQLLEALASESWSNFTFRPKQQPEELEHAIAVEIQAEYLGGPWCTVLLEVVTDADAPRLELVDPYDLTAFGLPETAPVPCLNIHDQMAQKIHAATEPAPGNRRWRDIVDVYLFETMFPPDDDALRTATEYVFTTRGTHAWPPAALTLSEEWTIGIRDLIDRLELEDVSPDRIVDAFNVLILRLLGVPTVPNRRYHFMILTIAVTNRPPTVLESVLQGDERYNIFRRMTETEGYRLVQLFPYPSAGGVRDTPYMLAVLERELTDGETIP